MVQTPLRDVTLNAVHNHIVSDAALEATERIRSVATKDERRELKVTLLDYFTPSGTFRYRRADDLIQDSGFIVIDFDHLDSTADLVAMREGLINCTRFKTALLFVSPSGDGLNWVIDAGNRDGLTRREYIERVGLYTLGEYSYYPDMQGIDVARACFLPHDPECYLNPDYRDEELSSNTEWTNI